MEFKQFKSIAGAISDYFGRKVIIVNGQESVDSVNKRSGVYSSWRSNPYKIIHSKNPGEPLFNNISIVCIRKRNGTFLKNIGFNDSDELLILMSIIREFGHFEYLDIIRKNGFQGQYKFLRGIVREYIHSAWTIEKYDDARKEGYDIMHMSRGDEMYCDGFAKDHFVPIMKLLKEKELI